VGEDLKVEDRDRHREPKSAGKSAHASTSGRLTKT